MGNIIRTQIKLVVLVAESGRRGLTTEQYKESLGMMKLYYIYICQNVLNYSLKTGEFYCA